jgi:hypothetical protein
MMCDTRWLSGRCLMPTVPGSRLSHGSLSTYLQHSDPSDTYWYLEAAPELMALAGERLERYLN